MPLLAIRVSPQLGARVRAEVTIGWPDLVRRRRAGQPIPQPFAVTALLDSGAERTCVDPSVVRRLSLPISGTGLTIAPGASPGLAALGGAGVNFSYEAGLVILHPVTRPPSNLVIPELVVEELPLAALGIEAIIGRDILASCVMVYDGPAGSVTLAY